MALSADETRAIAEYARIALTDAELEEMRAYLNDAIELLEPIRSFDLEGVEPTFHPIGDLANVMKADDASLAQERALDVDVALSAAVSHEGRAFTVPAILGDVGGDR